MEEIEGKINFRTRKRKDDFKISEETAQEQLAFFLDHYEIYPDEFETEDEKTAYNLSCNKLIIAVRKGKIVFEEKGTFKQILESGQELKYKQLSGKAKTQISRAYKKGEAPDEARMRRTYTIMGSLCGLGYKAMLDFNSKDMTIMECVSFLLSIV